MISWGTGDEIAGDVIGRVLDQLPFFGNGLTSIALCKWCKVLGANHRLAIWRWVFGLRGSRFWPHDFGENLQMRRGTLPLLEMMIPPPHQIFAQYESGEIEREELQALMALHARELITEMEEDHQNPAAAWIEQLLSRRAGSRLVKRHGSRLLREILSALADVADFPPARYLWNAPHPDVPIHCFFRIRREPVFRIRTLERKGEKVWVTVEYGVAKGEKPVKRDFVLHRDERWRLKAALD
jgi:hypothetical protein